ncbi:hypothetical protein QA648_22085 (plasmid) [Rhizobium sp. CB3171]|uniref:hypothetical protein n=1 Tax=Rhizobium sp. CB3171 TaxID=3039157 RepID=UPI0024B0FA4E|nr:hypothetical protein [Rhizobium sp. CB3171]WFU05853.1 hypothetical protein QA648_22085 [Rhizobium sp. CB3171]
MNDEGIKALTISLNAAAAMQNDAPWKLIIRTAVGGAFATGFVRDREELVVVSHSGQSVYDCLSGERTYRNREDNGYDWDALEAVKLNDPDHAGIPMAGIDGGGLRTSTADGWTIETIQLQWPTTFSILQPPAASIFFLDPKWQGFGKDTSYHLVMKSEGLPVAFGFSWSGKTLIWMDSSDLHIWSRNARA